MKSSDQSSVEVVCTFFERKYRSEDASYCVVQYQDEHGDIFTAVGSELPEFDYAVTLSGQWKLHPTFGDQFQVDMVVDILPRSKKDIVKFLLSISDQLSREQAIGLSQAFPPSELWSVLYDTPEKLYSICDIGESKILRLQREVKRLATRRDLGNLFGNELSMTKWQYRKVCDMFADDPGNLLDAVKENPFLLIHAGYHFQELDAFSAKHNRFAPHDYRRLLAATQSVLLDAQKESHTALPDHILVQKLVDMLRPIGAVTEASIQHFLHLACIRKDIVYIGNCFYLGRAYEEETMIAESLSAMAALPAKTIDRKKFQRCMEQYGEKKGFSLSENQQEAVWTVLTRPVCVITGGPGTGKSATRFCVKQTKHRHTGLKDNKYQLVQKRLEPAR